LLRLVEINEDNWTDFARLQLREDQRAFLDSPVGILARGYVYRARRARVIGIAEDGTVVGLALVKDLDEEPACYDLQQFLIDRRFQGRGLGTEALRRILAELEAERKYGCVEVCVKREDAAALRVYEKLGFTDTGYIDEDAPDCRNLMYRFPAV
jgi:Acetyltransferases, including N-acetylases of ribosomal proteins